MLLCINHPNNLIDSLLVGGALPRKVHYLATAALFRNPLLARFLLGLRRDPRLPAAGRPRQDGPQRRDLRGVLHRLRREGGSSPSIRRAPPTPRRACSGSRPAPRGSRSATRRAPGRLAVIPVGLTFEARKSFRGRVLVSFGEPVAVARLPRRLSRGSGEGGRRAHRRDPVGDGGRGRPRRAHRRPAASVRAVEELYRDELERELREERGLSGGRSTCCACRGRSSTRSSTSRRTTPSASSGSGSASRPTARSWPSTTSGTRPCGARRAAPGPAAPAPAWQAIVGFPLFAYGAARQRPALLRPALARPAHRPQGDRLRDDPAPGERSSPSRSSGGSRSWLVARLAGPRRARCSPCRCR